MRAALFLMEFWCSVGVISSDLLMRKLGIENQGHLPKIPAVDPGFKPRLLDLFCGPLIASLFPVPHCASATPSASWSHPGSVGERGR